MTTLVIGANGQIGRQFCELAKAAGEPIKAMVRSEEQRAWFEERGIDTVVADLEGELRHASKAATRCSSRQGPGRIRGLTRR